MSQIFIFLFLTAILLVAYWLSNKAMFQRKPIQWGPWWHYPIAILIAGTLTLPFRSDLTVHQQNSISNTSMTVPTRLFTPNLSTKPYDDYLQEQLQITKSQSKPFQIVGPGELFFDRLAILIYSPSSHRTEVAKTDIPYARSIQLGTYYKQNKRDKISNAKIYLSTIWNIDQEGIKESIFLNREPSNQQGFFTHYFNGSINLS